MDMNAMKRIMSLILCMALVLGNFSAVGFAAETGGLCDHHTVHEDCGYEEGSSDCDNVCDLCAAETEPATEEATQPLCTKGADCAAPQHEDGCEKAMADAISAMLENLSEPRDPQPEQTPEEDEFKSSEDFNAQLAQAATYSGTCGTSLKWSLDTSTGVLTISGSGAMESYSTGGPWRSYSSYITEVKMTGGTTIGHSAFENLSKLTKVTLPSTLTSIGSEAFYACTALTTITIPAKVSSVASYAFYQCSSLTSIEVNASNPNFTSIDGVLFTKDGTVLVGFPSGLTGTYTVPSGTTTISNAVFSHTDLTKIILPDTLTTIEEYAFASSGITEMTLPDSVQNIEPSIFSLCKSLVTLKLPRNLDKIPESIAFSCTSLETVIMPETTSSISSKAFWCCEKLVNVTIPAGVTSIGSDAFYKAGIQKLVLPEGVTSIATYAFQYCTALTEVSLPTTLTSIGNYAFASCTALKKITFTGNAPKLGNYAFDYAPATVYYPLKKADWEALVTGSNSYGANFKWQPYLGQAHEHSYNSNRVCSCGAIGGTCGTNVSWLFDNTDGTFYIFGKGAMSDYTYSSMPWYSYRSSIKRIHVIKGVTTLGDYAFYGHSNLESVALPSGITTIGNSAFYYCSKLTDVTLPSTVTELEAYAFYYSGLKSITLSYIKTVGSSALKNSYLQDVYYGSTQTNWEKTFGAMSNVRVHYSCTDPSTHWNLKNTGDTCITGGKVTEICKCTSSMSRQVQLPTPTASTLHNWSGKICTVCGVYGGTCGTNAYWSLDALGRLIIAGEGAVTSKGWNSYGSQILTATVKEGITTLPESAFGSSVTNMTQISFPSTLTEVGSYAFSYASGISRVDIPSLEAWLQITFKSSFTSNPLSCRADLYVANKKVTNLVIPEGITEIKDNAFAGCTSIQTAVLPEGVTIIGDSAFRDCDNLVSISMPNTLTTIDDDAFYYCDGLRSVRIPGSVVTMGSECFRYAKNLEHVVIEEGVTKIASWAFCQCTSLKSVVIPKTVTKIERDAFTSCPVTHVLYTGTSTQWGKITYDSTKYFTASSVVKHYGATGDEAQLNALCTEIACFCQLCDANIYSTVIEGGEHSYDNYICTKCGYVADLTSGECGEGLNWSLSATGTLTIYGAGAMTDYQKTDSLAPWLGDHIASIKKVVIRNGVTSIGSWAFRNCPALTEVVIPDSVTAIGAGAFSGCSGLVSVSIPDGITKLPENLFQNCAALLQVDLPDALTAIGANAFSGCSGLRYIALPAGLVTIETGAFASCDNLWHILFAGTETQKESISYQGEDHEKITAAVWHCETAADVITSPNTIACQEKILHRCAVCQDEFRVDYAAGSHNWVAATCVAAKYCSACEKTEGGPNLNVHDYVNGICSLCGIQVDSLEAQWPYAGRTFYLYSTGKTYYASAHHDTAVSSIVWLSAFKNNNNLSTIGTTISLSPDMSHPGMYYAYCTLGGTKYYLNGFPNNYIYLSTYGYGEWKILETWEGVNGYYLALDYEGQSYIPTPRTDGSAVWDVTQSGKTSFITFASTHKTHTYTQTVYKPTCTMEGYTLHQCSCGMNYRTDILDKQLHVYEHNVEWGENYASAKIKLVCTTCAETTLQDAVITESIITPVTCTQNGRKNVTATVSRTDKGVFSITRSVITTALGHNYVNGICDNCGEYEDPCMLGHDMGEWETVRDATCAVDGEMQRGCSRCDHVETDVIAAGHQFENGVCKVCKLPKGLTYTVGSNGVTITGYTGSLTELTIPATIDGLAVIAIGNNAFANQTGLTAIALPETLKEISGSAFYCCKGLTALEIPRSVTFIGAQAFAYCTGLKSIRIPEGVKSINSNTFDGCTALESVVIPETVTSIGTYAFNKCQNLTSLELPDGVTSIGYHAFAYCKKLESINIPENVTKIQNNVFAGCSSLTEIVLPDRVTSIGSSAFADCTKLNQINIPDGVTKIEANAFKNCANLTGIVLPESLTTLGSSAFYGCNKLASVNIPSKITEIADNTFYQCYALRKIILPDSVVKIGLKAFWNCSHLAYIMMPDTLTQIGDNAFQYCVSLWHVACTGDSNKWEANVTLGTGNFYLTDAVWHRLSTISELVDCDDTCTENRLFQCTRCKEIYSEPTGGKHTWVDATCLAPKSCSVCGETEGKELGHDMGEWETVKDATCTVDGEKTRGCSRCDHTETDVIKAEHDWNDATCLVPKTCGVCGETEGEPQEHIRDDKQKCTVCGHIGGYCGDELIWTYDAEAKTLTISGTGDMYDYTDHGPWSDYNNVLTNVVIGEGVTGIGNYAFGYAAKLANVVIPDNVLRIGMGAFSNCGRLQSITLPKNLTALEYYTFAFCYALQSVEIPEHVTELDTMVFYRCESLTYVNIPSGVKEIPDKTFYGCFALKNITIPEGVTRIGDSAFYTNFGLVYIVLPESLTEIDQSAFSDCTNLWHVIYCGSAEQWNDINIDEWENNYLLSAPHHDDCNRGDITPADSSFDTCVDDAVYQCQVCMDIYYVGIENGEHTWVDATCTAPKTCSVCGETVGEELGHDMGEWETVKAATCTEDGEKTRGCSRCDHTETDVIKAAGHQYGSEVTPPTCTVDGYTTYTCNCGDTYVDDIVNAEGHKFTVRRVHEDYLASAATCTEKPTYYFSCACGEKGEKTFSFGSANGHHYEPDVTPVTCTEDGYTTYTCHCGDSYIDDIVESEGHKWADATCLVPKTCDVCGETEGRELGHDMGDWETVKDATCTVDGEKTRGCSRCDHTETDVIQAEGHAWDDGVITREPTEDCEGEKTFTCGICGETKTEPVEYTAPAIPAVLDNVVVYDTLAHTTGNILYWNAVEYGDVYQIFRLNGTSWELLKNTRSLAFKDETAPVGVKSYYKIVARNGDSKSDIKTTASVAVTRPAAITKLDNVTITSVVAHNTGNILYWDAVANAKLYQVFRLEDGSWTLLTNTGSTAYKDETAPVGVKCYYKIVARNGDIKSDITTTASASATRPSAFTKLDNVTITSIVAHKTGNILYWDAVANAKLYQVFRLEDGSWVLLTNTGSTAYKDETAPVGVKCYYKIVARNGDIKSDITTTTSASATRPAG